MNENMVIICGRLGKDPELRWLPAGSAVCNFSVAISNFVKKDDGGFDEHTVWVDVTCWGKTAERIAEFGKPGTEVLVNGRIDTRSWEDKEDSTKKHYRTFVNASKVQAGQNRKTDGTKQQEKPADSEKPADADAGKKKAEDDDDLPF